MSREAWGEQIKLRLQHCDGLVLLFIRLYLAPVFWIHGMEKFYNINKATAWFASSNVNLPFPHQMAYAVGALECIATVLLLFGFAVRYAAVVLIGFLMMILVKIHGSHGWSYLARSDSPATEQLEKLMQWLRESHPEQLQSLLMSGGTPVMLNNGMQWTVAYLLLLLVLMVYGAGRYTSMDYWLKHYYTP